MRGLAAVAAQHLCLCHVRRPAVDGKGFENVIVELPVCEAFRLRMVIVDDGVEVDFEIYEILFLWVWRKICRCEHGLWNVICVGQLFRGRRGPDGVEASVIGSVIDLLKWWRLSRRLSGKIARAIVCEERLRRRRVVCGLGLWRWI